MRGWLSPVAFCAIHEATLAVTEVTPASIIGVSSWLLLGEGTGGANARSGFGSSHGGFTTYGGYFILGVQDRSVHVDKAAVRY